MVKQIRRFASIRLALESVGIEFRRFATLVGIATLVLGSVIGMPPEIVAQSASTGTVSGDVVDAQGAVITNASATLTSVDQGTTMTSPVNQRGEYLFLNVKPGEYVLSVTAPTFEKSTTGSVVVNATENVKIDTKLTRGSISATVTVEAASSTVDTRSATIATVIDPTLVQNLPVDGNNVVEMAALLPGVVDVNAPTTFTSDTGGPTYTVNGSRNNQNLFLMDGAMWNNVYYNTGLNFPPTLMLQEVSVQLVNFKAQYGRNVGSVFNVVTYSGTNALHGKLWEYAQNKALNAADYISGINPALVQNQFGASVGGPILRDKLFFYLGVQDLRSVATISSQTSLPTAAERGLEQDGKTPLPCQSSVWLSQGQTQCANFSNDLPLPNNVGLDNPLYSSNQYQLQTQTQLQSTAQTPAGSTYPYNPYVPGSNTAGCFAGLNQMSNATATNPPGALTNNGSVLYYNEVPRECWNPVSVNFINKYLPIPEVNGVPIASPQFLNTFAKVPRNDWNGLARVDWSLPQHTIDARYYVTSVNDLTANSVNPATPAVASYDQDFNTGSITSGNIGDTWVITPNLLNVVRVAYKRYTYTTNPNDPTTLTALGGVTDDPGHPTLPILKASNRFTAGSANSAYSYSVNADEQFDENLSWTHGNHNFQFGAEFLDLQYIHRFDQPISLTSNTGFTDNSMADFLFGFAASTSVGNGTNIGALDHAYYFYGQDDWRVTSRLTLNLGLRYELAKPWEQPDQQSVTWIPGYQSYRFLNTPASLAFQGDPGVPKDIIKTNYTNFAPRVGLAYDIFGNGRTVLRAGFGIFYDALNANTTGIGQPYHYQATYSYAPGSFSNPLFNLSAVPANYTTAATAQFGQPLSVNFADPNITEPYTEAVNFGFQQKIAAGTLEVNYVGKFGRHEIVPYDLNPTIYSCNPANSYFQSNPGLYCPVLPSPSYSFNKVDTQASDAARVVYPGFNYGGQGIVDNNSIGTSNYNGLQAIYTQRSRRSLTSVISYTYSRSLDDQSSGTTNANALPNPQGVLIPNVKINYGPSDFHSTHILSMGWTLALPTIGQSNAVAREVFNNWSFGGIFHAYTGHPFSVGSDGDYQLTQEPGQRAELAPGLAHYQPYPGHRHRSCANTYTTGGVPYQNVPCKVQSWFNPQSFNAEPNFGYQDQTSRNLLYGPAYIDTDVSLRRSINLRTRGMQLQLRADAFNVFNTPNLAQPAGTSIAGPLCSSGITLTTNPPCLYTNTLPTPATAGKTNDGVILATQGTNGVVGTNGRRVQIALIFVY